MKEIEARLMREGVALGVVLSAFGNGKADAQRLIVFRLGGKRMRAVLVEEQAEAKRGQPRIGIGDEENECRNPSPWPLRPLGRAAAPGRRDAEARRNIRNRNLGAQLIKRKPLHEIGGRLRADNREGSFRRGGR